MILKSKCIIEKNVGYNEYIGVDGVQILTLINGDEVIAEHIANVSWQGKNSPFPTPPGGPWETRWYPVGEKNTPERFRKTGCFKVFTDMEGDVFIHMAYERSDGCFICNPTESGKDMFNILIKYRRGLEVIQENVDDNRSQINKELNPIDYNKIGRVK